MIQTHPLPEKHVMFPSQRDPCKHDGEQPEDDLNPWEGEFLPAHSATKRLKVSKPKSPRRQK